MNKLKLVLKELRFQERRLCKNAELSIEDNEKEKAFLIINSGCKNDRRHCSAYCQECSDKYHSEK